MISLTLALLFALAGGWISRMCGGAPPKLPFGLDQWIYALPYLAAPLVFCGLNYVVMAAPFVYLSAVFGKRTGHGQYMDLGFTVRSTEPERLDFLVLLLMGKDHNPAAMNPTVLNRRERYARDALGLIFTGLSVTLMCGLVIALAGDVLIGLLISLSGALKAPAYMIGWAIYPAAQGKGVPYLNEATAIGEFLTGFFAYGVLATIILITGATP